MNCLPIGHTPTLPKDHIRRKAAKAFACGVDDPDIKIQLLLGGEKMIIKALQQASELQTMLVATKQQKKKKKTDISGESITPHSAKGSKINPMLELWTTGSLRD